MLLFANDSHFAGLAAAPIMEAHAHKVEAVFVSSKIRDNFGSALKVLRKCSRRYAAYRLLVDAVTRTNGLRGKGTVTTMARAANIPVLPAADVNTDPRVKELAPTAGIGVALNFDQMLRKPFLDLFPSGVINLHASRLPLDKGISPVLWAFARGDETIWATLYRIDEGLDSGPVYEQFEVPFRQGETAFALYERVCSLGGARLAHLIGRHCDGALGSPCPQAPCDSRLPFSWPDVQFDKMLKRSGRRLVSWSDVARALAS